MIVRASAGSQLTLASSRSYNGSAREVGRGRCRRVIGMLCNFPSDGFQREPASACALLRLRVPLAREAVINTSVDISTTSEKIADRDLNEGKSGLVRAACVGHGFQS